VLIGTCEIDKDTEADVGKAGNAHRKVSGVRLQAFYQKMYFTCTLFK
jgi:hypothetical protein